jgi:hypothetical protein
MSFGVLISIVLRLRVVIETPALSDSGGQKMGVLTVLWHPDLNETGQEAVPSDESAVRVILNRRRFDEAKLAT